MSCAMTLGPPSTCQSSDAPACELRIAQMVVQNSVKENRLLIIVIYLSNHNSRKAKPGGVAAASQPWTPTDVRFFVADAHRDDGKHFIVRADEKLTAFLELEAAIRRELA